MFVELWKSFWLSKTSYTAFRKMCVELWNSLGQSWRSPELETRLSKLVQPWHKPVTFASEKQPYIFSPAESFTMLIVESQIKRAIFLTMVSLKYFLSGVDFSWSSRRWRRLDLLNLLLLGRRLPWWRRRRRRPARQGWPGQVLGAPAEEQPGGQEESGRPQDQGEPAQDQSPLSGECQPGRLVIIPSFNQSYKPPSPPPWIGHGGISWSPNWMPHTVLPRDIKYFINGFKITFLNTLAIYQVKISPKITLIFYLILNFR